MWDAGYGQGEATVADTYIFVSFYYARYHLSIVDGFPR